MDKIDLKKIEVYLKKMFNAAIIGSGIGLKHLDAIENYKSVKVKFICEKNLKRALLLKRNFLI